MKTEICVKCPHCGKRHYVNVYYNESEYQNLKGYHDVEEFYKEEKNE